VKRSELRRLTPLTAKTQLKRTTGLNRSPLARSALHAQAAERQQQPKRRTARNTGPSAAVVAQVGQRDEWACVRCGGACHGSRGVDWSVQHRRARGMGGTRRPDTNEPQSLILLCGSATTGCHGWAESNRTAALSNGWAVKSNSDPLQVPVLHWQRGLIFLAADGSWSSRPPATAQEA
jgi:hypothetical protein